MKLFKKLGFLINERKSHKVPSTRYRFLGNMYDLVKMVVELPIEKQKKVKSKIEKFRIMKQYKIREFASFVGTLSSCLTLKYGRVYMRSFKRERFLALEGNGDNFEANMRLSSELKEDFDW